MPKLSRETNLASTPETAAVPGERLLALTSESSAYGRPASKQFAGHMAFLRRGQGELPGYARTR
ncbi:MAG TPA: hypothetical protein PKH89_08425 [Anaerolineae bacterium]|nr:hypothetical protein [Anaerolineae bacterium]